MTVFLAILGFIGCGWLAILILALGTEAVYAFIAGLAGAVLVLCICIFKKLDKLQINERTSRTDKIQAEEPERK